MQPLGFQTHIPVECCHICMKPFSFPPILCTCPHQWASLWEWISWLASENTLNLLLLDHIFCVSLWGACSIVFFCFELCSMLPSSCRLRQSAGHWRHAVACADKMHLPPLWAASLTLRVVSGSQRWTATVFFFFCFLFFHSCKCAKTSQFGDAYRNVMVC